MFVIKIDSISRYVHVMASVLTYDWLVVNLRPRHADQDLSVNTRSDSHEQTGKWSQQVLDLITKSV